MVNPMMAGAVGGVGGMVKALMDGQDQNSQQQKQQQMLQQIIASKQAAMPATGGMPGGAMAAMGTPQMRPQMPQPAGPMQGGMPFPQSGAAPMNIDPMTKALFSPIPGMTGGQ